MLVHRWLILRTPISHRFSIKKVIALVNVLAKLQNFCINELDDDFTAADNQEVPFPLGNEDGAITTSTMNNDSPEEQQQQQIILDTSHTAIGGDLPGTGEIVLHPDIEVAPDPEFGIERPLGLLDGGNHFEDYPRSLRRRESNVVLLPTCPREMMRLQVINSHLVRPNAPVED